MTIGDIVKFRYESNWWIGFVLRIRPFRNTEIITLLSPDGHISDYYSSDFDIIK